MSGKYKDVQQRIKDVCTYAEFCSCFSHALNLVRSYAVEANAAASNFFLMISSVKWSHLGQISNFKKIDLGQLLSNK